MDDANNIFSHCAHQRTTRVPVDGYYQLLQKLSVANLGPYSPKILKEHSLSISPRYTNWTETQLLNG